MRRVFLLLSLSILCRYAECFTSSASKLFDEMQHKRSRSCRSGTICYDQHQSIVKVGMTMKVRFGILGLPNVGKSTLFNALSQKSIALAANYPFCTIDPNIAPIAVPDKFLKPLGSFANSLVTKHATMEWVDVAGLAKGAHRGEGLGNKFLATLRECDALCHVVRMFEDPNVVHVDGKINPVADDEAIQLELIFADIEHIQRRLEKKTCDGIERSTLETIADHLQNGIPARSITGLSYEAVFSIKSMGLLTLKPMLYVFNVDEVDFCYRGENNLDETLQSNMESMKYCDISRDLYTVVSSKLEAELSQKSREQQIEYFDSIGANHFLEFGSGDKNRTVEDLLCYKALPSLAQKLLDLSFVYTGPGVPAERSRTTRAHLMQLNNESGNDCGTSKIMTAEKLAGRLHGDIEKGFIRAEVCSASNLLKYDTYVAAKEAGQIRVEGREYILHPDDVILIKWH